SFLEFRHFRTQDVLPVREDALDAGIDLVLDACLLCLEVDEVHYSTPSRANRLSRNTYRWPVSPQVASPFPSIGRSSCSPYALIQPIWRAGTPTTNACAGTSLLTTAPAPTKENSPIVTP